MTLPRHGLTIVPPEPEPQPASQRLAEIVPELIAAEALVAQLRASMKGLGCDLARERGVSFIREEHLRREFGHKFEERG